MAYPVYLLRQPAETLSLALFSPDTQDWMVVAIEHAVTGGSPSPIAQVISPRLTASATERQSLTYNELLDAVMKGGKVITL